MSAVGSPVVNISSAPSTPSVAQSSQTGAKYSDRTNKGISTRTLSHSLLMLAIIAGDIIVRHNCEGGQSWESVSGAPVEVKEVSLGGLVGKLPQVVKVELVRPCLWSGGRRCQASARRPNPGFPTLVSGEGTAAPHRGLVTRSRGQVTDLRSSQTGRRRDQHRMNGVSLHSLATSSLMAAMATASVVSTFVQLHTDPACGDARWRCLAAADSLEPARPHAPSPHTHASCCCPSPRCATSARSPHSPWHHARTMREAAAAAQGRGNRW